MSPQSCGERLHASLALCPFTQLHVHCLTSSWYIPLCFRTALSNNLLMLLGPIPVGVSTSEVSAGLSSPVFILQGHQASFSAVVCCHHIFSPDHGLFRVPGALSQGLHLLLPALSRFVCVFLKDMHTHSTLCGRQVPCCSILHPVWVTCCDCLFTNKFSLHLKMYRFLLPNQILPKGLCL